jgi:hypothetical protein
VSCRPARAHRAPRRAHCTARRSQTRKLVQDGLDKLVEYTHPDPYTLPTMPGGSKFMRNPPPPLSAVFPDGIPEDMNLAPQTVEGVQVPMSATPKGYDTVLIDLYAKTAR